jgi:hypothetical protein
MQRTITQLIYDLKFITGQDSLSDADAIRLFNYAKDRYSGIAIEASGRWKFHDTTHEDADGDNTYPIATATLNANEESIPLESDFLMINQVQIYEDGKYRVVHPIDTRDSKDNVLGATYATNGTPEYYDYDAHSLFIYPRSNTARTIKVLYSKAGKHFTTSELNAYSGIPSVHDEYLVVYAGHKLGFKLSDTARVDFRNELAKWEGADGLSGGIIRNFYSKRDQDTPRRLKAKIAPTFMGSARPRRH